MKTGSADLPLHGGKCPAWLFKHMKALGLAIMEVVLEEDGVDELLQRLSHPYWFQALGCVMGFDWHSSGLTTTVCGALKEALQVLGPQAGVYMAGGKGRTARHTPDEIVMIADSHPIHCPVERLIYASKTAAKVDSAAVQDGYQLYHHVFIFTDKGRWAVVQQGMNENFKQARRYHWLSLKVHSFVEEPQTAICCNQVNPSLNLVSLKNQPLRENTAALAGEAPESLLKELRKMEESQPSLLLPARHAIPRSSYLNRSLRAAYEEKPRDFEHLLQIPGVGAGTLRALCLVAEVAYGVKASYEDPVRYAFAHGGKDGFPFPVNESDLENSCRTLQRALTRARAGHREQLEALRRLAVWHDRMVRIKAIPSVSVRNTAQSAPQANDIASPGNLQQPELF